MAEADRLTRRDWRVGRKYILCILRELADFPNVVNSFVSPIPGRIQKLRDNGGIASTAKNPNLVSRSFSIETGSWHELFKRISILVDCKSIYLLGEMLCLVTQMRRPKGAEDRRNIFLNAQFCCFVSIADGGLPCLFQPVGWSHCMHGTDLVVDQTAVYLLDLLLERAPSQALGGSRSEGTL
jgi:hypothetical protein